MKKFILSMAMLLMVANFAIAQDDPGQIPDLPDPVPVPAVEVVTGTYLTAKDANYEIVGDKVRIFAIDLEPEQVQVAKLKTQFEEGWVFLYDRAKPFPPKITLLPAPVEITKPGIYDIQVLPIVDGKGSIPVFIEGIEIAPPTKVDPVEPDDPNPPVGDYENLKNLSKDLAVLVNDKEHAKKYLNFLEKVKFQGSLDSVQKQVGLARIEASRGGVKGQWYKFFQPLDEELIKAETLDQYSEMWKAVIAGLKESLQVASSYNAGYYGRGIEPIGSPIIYSNEPIRYPIPTPTLRVNCPEGFCPPR